MWERSCVQNISQPWLKWFLECQAHRLMGRIDGSNGQVELAVKDWQVALDDSPHRQWRSYRQAQPHNQNVCPCLEALREAMSVFFWIWVSSQMGKWGIPMPYPKMTTTWQLQYVKHGKARVWIAGYGDSLFLAWTNPYLEPSWVCNLWISSILGKSLS